MKHNRAVVGFALHDAISHQGGVLPLHVRSGVDSIVETVPTPIRML